MQIEVFTFVFVFVAIVVGGLRLFKAIETAKATDEREWHRFKR